MHVERLESYPVHGWVFTAAANVDSMAALVGALCMKLQVLNVPHKYASLDQPLPQTTATDHCHRPNS